jgi:hypothetical protein
MRKTYVAAAVATVLSAGAFLTTGANAMTLAAPAGARAAIEGTTSVDQVRYVCYRVWRHGSWHRHCEWRPGYYAARPYYYSSYPYYSRPYYSGYYGYGYYRRPGVTFRF